MPKMYRVFHLRHIVRSISLIYGDRGFSFATVLLLCESKEGVNRIFMALMICEKLGGIKKYHLWGTPRTSLSLKLWKKVNRILIDIFCNSVLNFFQYLPFSSYVTDIRFLTGPKICNCIKLFSNISSVCKISWNFHLGPIIR